MTTTLVSVAVNGGRLSKSDHPQLPLSLEELAAEAQACGARGATLLHFHVRDSAGKHSLDAGLYREALSAMQSCSIVLQISSEALGGHSVEAQVRCILDSGCAAVSLAFREICPEFKGEQARAGRLYAEVAERGIHVQHILYSSAEAARFRQALAAGVVVNAHRLCLLLVWRAGASRSEHESFSDFLDSCLAELESHAPIWFVCAFGREEQARLLEAAARGGHVRLGFENNLLRPDGTRAASNAEQVGSFVAANSAQGRVSASLEQARARLGIGTRTL